jgi:CheY-like chemotaxis protein
LNEGFDEFLSKPLRKNVLRDMVVKVCGEERLATDMKKAPSSKPTETSTENGVPAGASHILVVDDAPTMRLLLRAFLSGMGCSVSEASSGESAVELVRASFADRGNPDPIEMVICDMRMPPGITGIETARRIKRIKGAENLPVIGMTADDVSNAALQEAQGVGMVSLISKPLGRAALARFLAEYTGTVSSNPMENGSDADAQVFDKARALDNCSGDKALLGTLLADVSNDLKLRPDDIRTAVQRKDLARVAEVAHNIKGLAGMCGFARLAKAASECQVCASNSDLVETRTRSQVLLDEIAQAVKVADAYDRDDA